MRNDQTRLLLIFTVLTALALMGCSGADGKDGVNGAVGHQGDVGPTGPVGGRGPTGDDGLQGIPGLDGADGTQITIVKFCPGVTVYPTKFVEIGWCIEGSVYGTYSQNGGFSTLLPPGAYTSNAIGSSCSFTILANCGISH